MRAARRRGRHVLDLIRDVVLVVGQLVLGFYAFWLVWRVLLPVLPGPASPADRIAPFAGYFTDPAVEPLARALHLPTRAVAAVLLVVVATLSVALSRAAG